MWWFCVRSLFCGAVLCVVSSFAIISLGRECWLLYDCCVLNVMSLLSFLTLPHGAMDWSVVCNCGIPSHAHLLFLIFPNRQ